MTFERTGGVPRIIHQTWRSRTVAPEKGDPESWKRLNPDWEYRFWTDEDLRAFMAEEFPHLIDLFDGYSLPVQRADLARYCILYRIGGLYADIDTRCLATVEPLAGDERVILCEEPGEHQHHGRVRGLDTLFFNGTMASPPGHPFWESVLNHVVLMYPRRDADVLDTTGPCILTAAVSQWQDRDSLALNSSHLFSGLTSLGGHTGDARWGPYGHLTCSEHLWQGSWIDNVRMPWLKRRRAQWKRFRHEVLSRSKRLTLADARRQIDTGLLTRPLPPEEKHPSIAVLIPVRNCEAFLENGVEQLLALDYPKDRLHVVYGEGDSEDRTPEVIAEIIARHGETFASISSVRVERNGPRLSRSQRWDTRAQLARRSGIAMARNDLLRAAAGLDADWFLWIDADVIGLPRDLLQRLLAARAKIVTPDCVLKPGGASYDLNAFLYIRKPSRAEYYSYIRHGLFQPPLQYPPRRHLHDLRYLERVPLDSVGGTALLVHGDVHRAGLDFPEIPYRDLVETEGFGTLARDLGLTPIGLPGVEVVHHAS